jgi:hypothetical protein
VLYTAKCYWPGVTSTDLARIASQAETLSSSGGHEVAYLGSLWLIDDDLVLCLFEGPSPALVGRATEQTGIPWERLMASAWVAPGESRPFDQQATTLSAPPPQPPPEDP